MKVFVRRSKRFKNYPVLHKLECWRDMVDVCIKAVEKFATPLVTVFVRTKEGEPKGVHIYYTALPEEGAYLMSELNKIKRSEGKKGLVLGGEVTKPSQDVIDFLRDFGYEIEYL